jgi:hypothetical protein
MSKRKKLGLVALLLTGGIVGIQSVEVESRYQAIGLLAGAAYALSFWAMLEDLKGIEWLTTLILPVMYPVSVALFYFLLPERLLTRLVIVSFFGLGMYALLLTENIFNVAAMRTIQLLRAAHAVGFLLSLLTAFFLWDTIFSFRLAPWWNGWLIGLTAWPLTLAGLWCVNLEEKLTPPVIWGSLTISWCLLVLAFMVSFWPVTITVASLFLVTALYVGLGIGQQHLAGRLFKKTLSEYLWVGIIVLVTVFFLARWG